MPFGFRVPSIRKRIAARTSPARYVRNNLGLKMPRGWGWLTNPRKALYNRIYNRTTFGVDDLMKMKKRGPMGCAVMVVGMAGAFVAMGAAIARW